MKKEYVLISESDNPVITVQENSKEDFKKLMRWSEKEFKKYFIMREKVR